MNKHNCPHCKKELTLNNGEFYCKGENPYHIYYSTPEELKLHQEFHDNFWKRTLFPDNFKSEYPITSEEAFNGIKSKIESSNLNVYTDKLTVDQFQKLSNRIYNGQ